MTLSFATDYGTAEHDDVENGTRNSLNSSRNSTTRTNRKNVEVEVPIIGVTLRGKYQIKGALQTVLFGALIAGYGAVYLYERATATTTTMTAVDWDYGTDATGAQHEELWSPSSSSSSLWTSSEDSMHRLLQGKNSSSVSCDSLQKAEPSWMAVFYSIGVLYMFLALAIVCDEFFVPALEEMSSSRRLNLSMDVAGATLMAAGGSAPELFTSLIGTFRESEIGFGTIVGSAVFNVLFVIGMCSIMAKELLTLTWWPLFRDSSYYTLGLVMLAIFSGVVSPNEIVWWEALVLFIMYIGYILLMWQNANLYKALTGKVLEYPDEDEEEATGPDEQDDGGEEGVKMKPDNNEKPNGTLEKEIEAAGDAEAPESGDKRLSLKKTPSKSSVLSRLSAGDFTHHSIQGSSTTPHFRWQGTFRAGILKLLKDPESWMDTAGAGIVAKIAGDADYVFSQVDIDGNGHVDREELKQLFNLLEVYISPQELEEVFSELDIDGDGTISQKEFTEWYCKSEERILSQVRNVFDKIDVDHSNTLDKEELKTLLATLDPHVTDEDVQSAFDAMYKDGSRDHITFEEFSDWYKHSMLFEREKQQIEEDMEGVWDNLRPPKGGGCRDWSWYIIVLPLVLVMTLTIPDVTRPGMGKWCYASFVISIAWIGGFSWLMVDWAEIIGNTIGIPSVIMGLTILAAGTSVPDLLSSVIVARRGQGDMAVSSSVGSNIFDILVGLPVPWLLYNAIRGDSVFIGSDGLFRSLIILIAMLVLVIAAVHCQGWKLSKTLGGIMFFFYIAFLVQAVVLALPFELCTD